MRLSCDINAIDREKMRSSFSLVCTGQRQIERESVDRE